jgi:hypothetical protein
MKSLFKTVVLFTFFSASIFAQPSIRLGFSVMDVGSIYHGEVRTVPLVVQNTGTEPLNILGIETSCGCTSAKRSSDAIAPGKEDTITVSFNSLGFYGSITKIVTVRSNDPAHSQVEARLTGTVTSLLETVPPMQVMNFGGAPAGTPTKVTFQFRNTTSEPITIRNISSVDPALRSSFASGVIAPNDTIAILFSVTPPSKAFAENYFYIETTDLRQPRIPFRFMYLGQ